MTEEQFDELRYKHCTEGLNRDEVMEFICEVEWMRDMCHT